MPVKVIFKSSKLVPTMVFGSLLNGQVFRRWDWVTSVMLCICITIFSLADSQVSLQFSAVGILFLGGAVVCDSLVPQSQQFLMSPPEAATKAEIIFFNNGLGALAIMGVLVITGEGVEAFQFCAQQPAVLLILFCFGLVTYAGSVAGTVREYD